MPSSSSTSRYSCSNTSVASNVNWVIQVQNCIANRRSDWEEESAKGERGTSDGAQQLLCRQIEQIELSKGAIWRWLVPKWVKDTANEHQKTHTHLRASLPLVCLPCVSIFFSIRIVFCFDKPHPIRWKKEAEKEQVRSRSKSFCWFSLESHN